MDKGFWLGLEEIPYTYKYKNKVGLCCPQIKSINSEQQIITMIQQQLETIVLEWAEYKAHFKLSVYHSIALYDLIKVILYYNTT